MSGAKVKADPEAWIRVCDRMLKDSEYSFGWDYIEKVRDWIAENDRVTSKQINAIQNIRRGADRL